MKKVNVKKAVLTSLICNTLVWYDYVLFGSLASVISQLFFPIEDKFLSLIATFSVFAVGFLMRPFGASIFGHIGDKYGRKIALLISIIFMSVPVAFISIIPVYSKIGMLAPILLTICRLVQGFSLGGEAGNATFLIEHSTKGKNSGLFGSFEVLSAVIGSITSLIIVSLCQHFSGSNFMIWGWRLPFIFGLFIGLISTYMRYKSNESPAYNINKKKDNLSETPFLDLIRNYRKPLLLAICIDCVENAAFYMFMVFFAVYIKEISGIDFNNLVEMANILIVGILTVIFASLSDIIGRKKVMGTAFIIFLFISLPVFWLLTHNNHLYILLAYLIFAIPFAGSLGPASAAMSELFPTKVRYTGFGLSRNISGAIAGGLTPVISTWLIKITDVRIAPGLYMMFWAVIGLTAIYHIKPSDIYKDW